MFDEPSYWFQCELVCDNQGSIIIGVDSYRLLKDILDGLFKDVICFSAGVSLPGKVIFQVGEVGVTIILLRSDAVVSKGHCIYRLQLSWCVWDGYWFFDLVLYSKPVSMLCLLFTDL